MFAHTLLLKRKGPVVVSSLLFGWMVLNSSTPALAHKRRDDWNRKSGFSSGSHCRNEARRDHRYNQRDNYYQQGGHYQRARDYRQDRYDHRYRSNRGRGYNQYQSYDRNWDDGRHRGSAGQSSTTATSTDQIGGRRSAMRRQDSPSSALAKSWPVLVPK